MEAEFVRMPSFSVVGLNLRTTAEVGQVAKLWGEFIPRCGEIQTMTGTSEMYGVMYNYDEKTGQFDYLACVQTHDETYVPDGMKSLTIPEQTYAVFATTLPTERETYRQIAEWMPSSGYQRTQGPEFERYDAQFNPNDSNSVLYLCIPVMKVVHTVPLVAAEVF